MKKERFAPRKEIPKESEADTLEREARELIVSHGKAQMTIKRERGTDLPNMSLEEAKQKVLESRQRVQAFLQKKKEILDEERRAAAASRAAEKRFMNRPDESFTMEEYEEMKGREMYGSLSDNSNNPNRSSNSPYAGNIRRLKRIEKALKRTGRLPAHEDELISYKLDDLYPKAGSKDVVEYEGKHYRSRYFPLSMSNSGKTVYAWDHFWEEVKDTDSDTIQ